MMTTEKTRLINKTDGSENQNAGASATVLKDTSKKMADVLNFVDYDTMRRLCMLLNPPDIFGNDWRMLADRMGFTYIEIRNIQEREKNPTQALLLVYKTRTGKGNKELLSDLLDYTLAMGREDCVITLKDALDGDDVDDLKIDLSVLTCGKKSILTEQLMDASEFHYGRLCCLLLKEGTEQIRNYLLNNLPSGFNNISDLLHTKTYKMEFRLLREQEVLTQNQFSKLYPPSCKVDPFVFDQELLFILIKQLVNKGDLNWRKYPNENETKPEHDVIRLKHLRNRLIHKSKTDLSQNEFDELFSEISRVLLRMGQSPESVSKYSNRVPISDIPNQQQEYSKAMAQLKEEFIRTTMAADFTPTRKFNRFMGLMILCFVMLLVGVSVFLGIYLSKPKVSSKCAKRPGNHINARSGIFKYKSRNEWSTRPIAHEIPYLETTPAQYVFISHTAGLDCVEQIDCCQSVIDTQTIHMDTYGWPDIGYSFLIGTNGVIYEGRGWKLEGAHTYNWNQISIGISFIGDFREREPSEVALRALREILLHGVTIKRLTANYTLYGHCQVQPFQSPGEMLYRKLMAFDHWRFRNVSKTEVPPSNRSEYCFDEKPKNKTTELS